MVWVQRHFEFIFDDIKGLQLVLDLYRTLCTVAIQYCTSRTVCLTLNTQDRGYSYLTLQIRLSLVRPTYILGPIRVYVSRELWLTLVLLTKTIFASLVKKKSTDMTGILNLILVVYLSTLP